jgi:hypothetical protein
VLGTSEITVVDSLMGLGKTTYILDQLRQFTNPFTDRKKVIVLVPLRSEIERYQLSLPAFAFKEPSERDPKRLRKIGQSWRELSSPPAPSSTRWIGNCTPTSRRLAMS